MLFGFDLQIRIFYPQRAVRNRRRRSRATFPALRRWHFTTYSYDVVITGKLTQDAALMRISSLADQYVSDRVKPFLFLSHPVTKSPSAISEYWSRYYTSGPDDIYLLIGWGAVLVTLRWILLVAFRNFARWWLSGKTSRGRSPERKGHSVGNGMRQANGVASAVGQNGHATTNGNGVHSRIGNGLKKEDEALALDSRRLRAERMTRKALAKRERTATRFAEQGTVFVYYIIAWLFGLVCAVVVSWYRCFIMLIHLRSG